MQDGHRCGQSFVQCYPLTSEECIFIDCDTAHVFHGSRWEFRNEHLIIFWKWKRLSKEILIESNSGFGHIKHLFEASILYHWFPSINSERWDSILCWWFMKDKWACYYWIKICWYRLWFIKYKTFGSTKALKSFIHFEMISYLLHFWN